MGAKVMRNSDIVKLLLEAQRNHREVHFNIYDDGCWTIDMERHPYGAFRFWVSYEDKRDWAVNGSICTVYDSERCAADFPLKQCVRKKVLSTYNALVKAGLVKE